MSDLGKELKGEPAKELKGRIDKLIEAFSLDQFDTVLKDGADVEELVGYAASMSALLSEIMATSRSAASPETQFRLLAESKKLLIPVSVQPTKATTKVAEVSTEADTEAAKVAADAKVKADAEAAKMAEDAKVKADAEAAKALAEAKALVAAEAAKADADARTTTPKPNEKLTGWGRTKKGVRDFFTVPE